MAFVPSVLAAEPRIDLTVKGGGNITSTSYATSLAPYWGDKAFDNGGTGDTFRWLVNKNTLPNGFLIYEFPGPTCVNGYSIQGFDLNGTSGLPRDPKKWIFEGSNDKLAWTLLDAQVDQTNWTARQIRTFDFVNTQTYIYYKFTIQENNGATDYSGCLELEYYGWEDYESQPVIVAQPVTQTQYDTATLHGSLNKGKTANVTVYWGRDPANWTGSQSLGNIDVGAFSCTIDGLAMYRPYYWVAHAVNSAGEAWSTTNTFTTLTGPDLTSPDGLITGCSSLAPYLPAKAFDDGGAVDTSRWLAHIAALPNAFVQYQFGDRRCFLSAYKVVGLCGSDAQKRSARSWTLSGSRNGIDWVLIDTQSNQTGWGSGQARTFAVNPDDGYEFFRFNISANNGATDYAGVLELELVGQFEYVRVPEVIALPAELAGSGSVKVKGRLNMGMSANAFVAWGNAPNNLSTTNAIGQVATQQEFSFTLSDLGTSTTWYYTLFVENEYGFDELDEPLSFITEGEHFTWTKATSGNWSEAVNWSQGQRAPGIAGDLVSVNTIRTIHLDQPSVTIGGLSLSGPYAAGPVIITNTTPGAKIIFDNPAVGGAFIDAKTSAPYLIYPDLVLNGDVSVSTHAAWPVTLRGIIAGSGKFVQQSGSRIILRPVTNVTLDSRFITTAPTAYLSVEGASSKVTLKGANTFSFFGTWDASSTLYGGATLIFDGGFATNLNASTRCMITRDAHNTLILSNGVHLVNAASAGAPFFEGMNNTVTLTDSGTLWDLSAGAFSIGGATNALSVVNGARFQRAPLSVYGRNSATSISGAGTLWNVVGTFCIGRGSHNNFAEITDDAVVTNCVLFVGGRYAYDNPGGTSNSVVVSRGAKLYSTLNNTDSVGGGVGVSGHATLSTSSNSLLVTDEGSRVMFGNYNCNIGSLTAGTGVWNRVSVANNGVIDSINTLCVGASTSAKILSASNSVHAASGGSVTCTTAQVGNANSHGNRLITAGGKITAKTITVATGNGIGAVLGTYEPVPITATQSAVFEQGTFVYPERANRAVPVTGGIIFTAPSITDNGLELAPVTDRSSWHLVKTPTSIALFHTPRTLFIVR